MNGLSVYDDVSFIAFNAVVAGQRNDRLIFLGQSSNRRGLAKSEQFLCFGTPNAFDVLNPDIRNKVYKRIAGTFFSFVSRQRDAFRRIPIGIRCFQSFSVRKQICMRIIQKPKRLRRRRGSRFRRRSRRWSRSRGRSRGWRRCRRRLRCWSNGKFNRYFHDRCGSIRLGRNVCFYRHGLRGASECCCTKQHSGYNHDDRQSLMHI